MANRFSLIFLLGLLMAPFAGSAQFYMEFGYRTGAWTKPAAVNQIIDDYNSIRPWLDQKMSHFNTAKGYRFLIGTQASEDRPVGVTFDIERLRTIHDAQGTEPTTGQLAYRRIMMSYGGLGMGFNFSLVRNEWFDWLLGLEGNVNIYTLRTLHSYQSDFSNPDEDEPVLTHLHPTLSIFNRFAPFAGPIGIGITPMYEFAISKADAYPLGDYLNKGTTSSSNLIRPSSFSIMASLIFCPRHRGES